MNIVLDLLLSSVELPPKSFCQLVFLLVQVLPIRDVYWNSPLR